MATMSAYLHMGRYVGTVNVDLVTFHLTFILSSLAFLLHLDRFWQDIHYGRSGTSITPSNHCSAAGPSGRSARDDPSCVGAGISVFCRSP